MEKNYLENQDETEVYLKDLLFYLLKRWRSLLVVILVGALLGAGFSAVRSMRSSSDVSVEEAAEPAEESEEIVDTEESIASADNGSSGLNISFRWVLLGVIGMIVLWGIVLVIRYLVDVSIKTPDEIKDTYHLPILGRFDTGNSRKGLDGWLDSLYKRTEEPSDTIPYISSNIRALRISQIALCGDTGEEMVSSVMEEIRSSSNQMECMMFIGKDGTALERTTELGKEIMIVQTGRTSRKTVQRELELCELQNIEMLGVIVIENA